MQIKWSPTLGQQKTYKQPIKDVLEINGLEYDFSDENIVKFDVSEVKDILTAERIDGVLHLQLRQGYTDKTVWEDPNYYPDGGYRGTQFEDYGSEVDLV